MVNNATHVETQIISLHFYGLCNKVELFYDRKWQNPKLFKCQNTNRID